MADSKLRLQIVTALDNAGIKATKEQIENLHKELRKVNSSTAGSAHGAFGAANEKVGMLHSSVKTLMKDVTIAVGLTKVIGTSMTEVYTKMV